jgi:peptidoglycan hydrolase-like protein with peptidoglycan-binding domain
MARVTLDLPTLRRGDQGGTVFRLQQMLDPFVSHGEKGTPVQPLQADGVFGSKTERAVKAFQGGQLGGAIAADGIVGPNTWRKLLTQWLSGNEPG